VCAFFLLLFVWLWQAGPVPAQAQAVVCAGSAVTGVVFRDYNFDGSRDALEPGLAGIVVTANDSAGGATSCTTKADGAYGIDPTGAYPLRLEYTLPEDGSLTFLQPGVAGANSRTTVTFVDGPSEAIDVAFSNPRDYCHANPTLTTNCAIFGEQGNNPDGVNKTKPVLYSFPYNAGSTDITSSPGVRNPPPTPLALAQAVGTTWGLAWSPLTERLYAAAFLKRHAGYGPNGPGAIYAIGRDGVSTLFYDLGTTAVGSDPHATPGQSCLSGHNGDNKNSNCWLHDVAAFDLVGKMGLGDLDISDDFQTLYTVNLLAKTLVALPIANPANNNAFAIPQPANCPTDDFRPFGLGVQDGSVYVGAVCTAESTGNRNDMRAYVFQFANNAFTPTPVFTFGLNYTRDGNADWRPWLNRATFDPITFSQQGEGKWGQPWLTDIAFDNGAMVLGLRDRNSDLFGVEAGGPDPSDSTPYTGKARGDIVRACPAANGGWLLESNGQCGGITTAGANNGYGPDGGEYYFQDDHPRHEETSNGAQLQIPGLPDIVSVIYNPISQTNEVSYGGIKWLNNRTGTTTRSYLIFDGSGEVALFDKANGLGDIEALCNAAPLEIGNRIWQDGNGNGVQDPNEAGINGVTVELYQAGVLVGSSTTTGDGNYLFNESNVTLNGASGIQANTCGVDGLSAYTIQIPHSSGVNQQAALVGLTLTQANQGGVTNGDLRDSNGALVGDMVVYAIPCAALASVGMNNHTFDFGFTAALPTATPTASPTSTATPTLTPTPTPTTAPVTYSLGNYVWFDTNRNGLAEANEPPAPSGLLVELLDGAGAPTGRTTLTNNGFYLFSGLNADDYRVRLAAANFALGQPLADYTSSDGPGQEANPNDNGDQNDNGLDGDAAAVGITSGVVTLGDGEPLGETPTAGGIPGNDGQQTPDANSNLTVDFGLIPIPISGQDDTLVAIGNFVFLDRNNNGRFEAASETGLAGVSLQLFKSGSATPLASTLTNSGGFYVFDDLDAGPYVVCVAANNFIGSQLLRGHQSSPGAGNDAVTDQDGDENGQDTTTPASNGVCSNVIDLQPNQAPVGEPQSNYSGQLDDNNVNFTVDFGFAQPTNLEPGDEPTVDKQRLLFLPLVRQ
jgi:hypothetical protein